MLTTYTRVASVVVRVRVQPSPFNGGEQGRRLKRIYRCDIERRILTGGRWMGRFRSIVVNSFRILDYIFLHSSTRLYFFYQIIEIRDNNRNRVKNEFERNGELSGKREIGDLVGRENLNRNWK